MTDIKKLRELLEAATPGPWYEYQDGQAWKYPLDEVSRYNNECLVDTSGRDDKSKEEKDLALIVAAINSLPSLLDELEARQWQPIETAPKDGSSVLLWVPENGEAQKGYYCDMEFWVVEGMGEKPTHWMPLPLGPGGKDSE